MTRRRVIFICSMLVAGVFVIAVQRETFLRRWLLPVSTPRRPLLDREIGPIRLSSRSYDEALAQLSQAANIRVEYFTTLRSSDEARRAAPPFVRAFDHVTVERVLYAIIEHWRTQIYFGGTLTEEGETIHVGPYWPGRPVYLEVYEVADLSAPCGQVPIRSFLADAAHTGGAAYLGGTKSSSSACGVWQIGSRFFVMADAPSHHRIAAMLAERRQARPISP